jgi:hypothetical protein
MVYRQPDAEIRSQIIEYLQRSTAAPASMGRRAWRGGGTHGDRRMTSATHS